MAGEIELLPARALTHVVGRDFTGLAGQAAMPNARPSFGRKWGVMGDSLTAGSGAGPSAPITFVNRWSTQAFLIAGRLDHVNHVNAGNAGETSAQMLARFQNDIVNAGCEGAIIFAGVNDAGYGVAPPAYIANILGMLDICRTFALPAVVVNVPPAGAAALDLAARTRVIDGYNLALQMLVSRTGAYLVDVHSALTDPATGYMLATHDADGVHPNGLGHLAIAQAVAPAMQAVRGRASLGVDALKVGSSCLIANPLMNGTIGDSNRPSGWYVQPGYPTGTVTYGVRAKSGSLQRGQWFECQLSGAATAIFGLATVVGYAADDKLALTCHMEIEDVAGNWTLSRIAGNGTASVRLNNGGTPLGEFILPNQLAAPPHFYMVTAPATGLLVWFSLVSVAGQNFKIRIGELQIYNLTALGLDTLIL